MFGTRRALLSSRRSAYGDKVLSVQRTNLLAYWKLGEPSGTTIGDSSGNARNGTYIGVDLGQPGIGDGGTSPLFDGTSDAADVYSASLASAFNGQELTIMLWFKMAAAGTWTDGVVRRILTFQVDANNRVLFQKNSASGSMSWSYIAGAVNKSITKSSMSSTGWNSMALTASKTADQVKAYINGVQEGATLTGLGTWAGTLPSNSTVLGSQAVTPSTVHSGNLAHCAVWNTALSAADIAKLAVVSG